MYSREKLTIKGRASRRVFPSKNALQTKRPVFYSPGEFTGRRSETHRHKRKVEILRFRAKRELSSNLPPKRKNRPEDRSAENFENGGGGGSARFVSIGLKIRCKMRFPSEKISNLARCAVIHPTTFRW